MWESIIQTDCPEEIIPEWHNIVRKIVTDRVERVVSINLYQLPFDIFVFIFSCNFVHSEELQLQD